MLLKRVGRIAIGTIVMTVALLLSVRGEAKRARTPKAALGNAAGAPDPTRRPWSAVHVAFGASRPPKVGTEVTVVSADPALPVLLNRVVGNAFDDHDHINVVFLEPILDPAWTGWKGTDDASYYFPPVVVLLRRAPNARLVKQGSVRATDLSPGTRRQDVVMAVDGDADGRVDVVGRRACEDRSRSCEEWFCNETWVRERGGWQMQVQECGD